MKVDSTTARYFKDCRRFLDEWRYLTEEDGLPDRVAVDVIARKNGLHRSIVVGMIRRARDFSAV